MGGRDHSCEVCGKGGLMSDLIGECDCEFRGNPFHRYSPAPDIEGGMEPDRYGAWVHFDEYDEKILDLEDEVKRVRADSYAEWDLMRQARNNWRKAADGARHDLEEERAGWPPRTDYVEAIRERDEARKQLAMEEQQHKAEAERLRAERDAAYKGKGKATDADWRFQYDRAERAERERNAAQEARNVYADERDEARATITRLREGLEEFFAALDDYFDNTADQLRQIKLDRAERYARSLLRDTEDDHE